jgi:CHAT domain-containing protein/tetratricopeptide (TPR) repeat protein
MPSTSRRAWTIGALLVAFAAGVGSLHAQPATPAPSEQLDVWLVTAESLLQAGKHAEAGALFERARDAAKDAGRDRPRAWALCGLGEVAFAQGRYMPARSSGLDCLALYEQVATGAAPADREFVDRGLGRANHLLGVVAEREGNAADATRYAERAVASYEAAGDARGRALATLQMLRVSNLGLERERALYDRVIADARAFSDPVIDLLFNDGRYAEALAKLEAAAPLFEASGRQVELGVTYNSLGRLYRAHGRLDAALAYQLKALAIHEKANARFEHLQSLNAVAVTYRGLGDSRQARVYFERALTLAEQISTPRIQDFVRANLAWTLLEDGAYQQAADVLEGVIARGLDTYPGVRMRDLAEAYLHLGRNDLAMAWAQKSVDRCGARESIDCIRAFDRRAEVHAASGDDVAALADLRSAMSTLEAVRAHLVPADFLKQQFNLAEEELYSRAIALQQRQGRIADALETAEHARSRAFVDLLASRDLPIETGREPARAGSARAADPTAALPLVFRGPPLAGPAADTPGDNPLRSVTAVPAASHEDMVAVAARLRSTILAYWVAKDEIFIWVVSPDGTLRASRVDVRLSRLLELIRQTTPLTEDGQGVQLAALGRARPWRDLYDLLVKPVRDELPRTPGARVTIVPHGPLGAVAFAGLQDERGRYLLESFTLHYAPSGAVLQFTQARRRPDARAGRMLLVADPVPPVLSGHDRPLPRLPGARAESRLIAALVPRARLTRLEGEAARERDVRDAAADKAVLHFATHAVVHDDDPFASFLALGRSNDAEGLLTAQEIYRLRLDADLVVLSGCRSAGGRVTGDGVATFARAFIYAGTASVVASLWDVADEPTSRLFADFYRSWLAGASKARALRSAQLRLLHALRAGTVRIDTPAGPTALPEHPVFWAGFTLIGEPD